jgi:hypothetical protein
MTAAKKQNQPGEGKLARVRRSLRRGVYYRRPAPQWRGTLGSVRVDVLLLGGGDAERLRWSLGVSYADGERCHGRR